MLLTDSDKFRFCGLLNNHIHIIIKKRQGGQFSAFFIRA